MLKIHIEHRLYVGSVCEQDDGIIYIPWWQVQEIFKGAAKAMEILEKLGVFLAKITAQPDNSLGLIRIDTVAFRVYFNDKSENEEAENESAWLSLLCKQSADLADMIRDSIIRAVRKHLEDQVNRPDHRREEIKKVLEKKWPLIAAK